LTSPRVLDTDTCIDLLRGRQDVQRQAAAVAPDDCAVSTVTIYELLTGVEKCRDPETERDKVETLVATLHELAFDHNAAARTAGVRARMEGQGATIGPYDVMLAGQALAQSLTLVTSNRNEFRRVRGLRTENGVSLFTDQGPPQPA
jgi:tRNA(fMet)-specific endonuclease VapC